MSHCGGRFGTRKSTKTVSKLKLDSSITLHRRFQPSEGLLGHCWHPCWDPFGVLVWDPCREGEFLKIIEKPREINDFQGSRGSEI